MVIDGIGQSQPDLGLVGLRCSGCNSHIGFLEIDTISSQFTYLAHSSSVTKKENEYICAKCGKTLFDNSPHLSTDLYLKFKVPVNQEALKYEILNLSVNQQDQLSYKINDTFFTNLQRYPSGIVVKLSTIKSLLSGNLKN
jgi:DNA-directed RNA polymerase subunit RPC12/RpoP